MGADGLKMELEAVGQEIAEARESVAVLQRDERSAVEQHDRVALDQAWAEHDRRLEQLRTLEGRQEEIRRELVRQAELAIERWKSSARARVQQWQEATQELLHRLSESIAQIEAVLAEFQEQPQLYRNERAQLLEELAALRPHDLAAELSEPEIEWTEPSLELGPIASRLVELVDTCRGMNASMITSGPAAERAELVQVGFIGATADDEAEFSALVNQGHPASVTFVDSDGSLLGSFYVQFKKPAGGERSSTSGEMPWW